MIYLDTHVIVWLYAGEVARLSSEAKRLINEHEVFISTVVRLELQYLFEIERITQGGNEIVSDVAARIGLKTCDKSFDAIIGEALALSWTRDPFDRIIVANASLNDNILLTKDQSILQRYQHAKW